MQGKKGFLIYFHEFRRAKPANNHLIVIWKHASMPLKIICYARVVDYLISKSVQFQGMNKVRFNYDKSHI